MAGTVALMEASNLKGSITHTRFSATAVRINSRRVGAARRGKLQLSASTSDPGHNGVDSNAVDKQQQDAARNVMAGRNAVSTEMGGKGDFSALQERINSGEYGSAQGSKKERITRPLRKALAKDPIGPGATLNTRDFIPTQNKSV